MTEESAGLEQSSASRAVGEMVRRQRELAAMSLRQVAALAGISNPYLSQIERGLRAPSPEVLSGIADSLRVPIDVLTGARTQGAPDIDPVAAAGARESLVNAIRAEETLTVAQRRALLEIYSAMLESTALRRKRRNVGEPASGRLRGRAAEF